MIHKDAGMFCDLAPFLIAAAVFFGCTVSSLSLLDDVDAWRGQLARITIDPGWVIPGRPFAFLRRQNHHVDNQTRLQWLGCRARPANLHAVAEGSDRFLFTNHVHSRTEIQHGLC